MNVSLTAELEKYVRRKVASGLYNNASEVIREALRLLVAREAAPPTRPSWGSPNPEPPRKDEILVELSALKNFLRDRGLKSLALFGPIVHGAARPDSDINVLVEVDLGAGFSVNDLPEVKNFLQDRLGRRVDVVTRERLDPAVRDRVLHEAEAVF
jgi:predicted nucleotidyltransferase